MADVLKFEEALRPPVKARSKTRNSHPQVSDDTYSFWPEVESGLWVADSAPVDAANSPKRVFVEIGLIFSAMAALVLLTAYFALPV